MWDREPTTRRRIHLSCEKSKSVPPFKYFANRDNLLRSVAPFNSMKDRDASLANENPGRCSFEHTEIQLVACRTGYVCLRKSQSRGNRRRQDDEQLFDQGKWRLLVAIGQVTFVQVRFQDFAQLLRVQAISNRRRTQQIQAQERTSRA